MSLPFRLRSGSNALMWRRRRVDIAPGTGISQFARPTTDITDGGWTDQTGGTVLAGAIDETVASDADYIQSGLAPIEDRVRIKLGSLSDPASSTGHVVRYRIGKNGATTINLIVRLIQGADTVIAQWGHIDIATGPTDVAQTLTSTEANSITDYTDLYLEFDADTFTPASYAGLAVWYDAQAISAVDGSAVSQWDDLSGNARHATQATGTKQPLYQSAGLNGLPSVAFDGTDDGLVVASSQLTTGKQLTVYLVAAPASGTEQMLAEFSADATANAGGFLVKRTTGNTVAAATRNTATTEWQTTATLTAAGIVSARFDRTPLAHVATAFVNGVAGGDETSATDGAGGSTFGTYQLFLGSRNNGASLPLNGPIGEVLIYAGAHMPAQRRRVEAWLAAKWNLRVTRPGAWVVFEGDSLTNGYPVQADAYPHTLMSGLTGNHDWVNVSVGSQTLATMQADIAQVTGYYSALNTQNVCVLWGGLNDLSNEGGGQTAATALSRFYGYADALRTAGFTVIGLTMTPRGTNVPAGFETERTTFNSDVRTNWASHFDGLVDVAADTRIGDAGDELNTTYYQTDKTHLTAAGYQIVADLVETALAGLGIT